MTTTIYTSLHKRADNFLNKATKKHNGFYDLSKVDYINAKSKVEIICPKHGSFWQKPDNHLSGNGCKQCANEESSILRIKYIDYFIDEITSIHSKKYSYDKSVYKGFHRKIEIECNNHGSFWQRLSVHIKGHGCPKCAKLLIGGCGGIIKENSKYANDICYLYDIKLTGNNEIFYKTGISNNYVERHNTISTKSRYKIEVINLIIDTRYNCYRLERKILLKRQRNNKYIPLIKFNGHTECYIK